MSDPSFPTLLRPQALGTRWGVSSATIRRLMREGKLPKPVTVSPRVFGWPVTQIEKIEAEKAKAAAKGSK